MWGNLCNSEEIFSAHKKFRDEFNCCTWRKRRCNWEKIHYPAQHSLYSPYHQCQTVAVVFIKAQNAPAAFSGMKFSPSGKNGITLVQAGLQHLDLMCLQRLMNVIPDWFLLGNLPSLPLAFPLQHFPTPSPAIPLWRQRKSKGQSLNLYKS